MDNYVPNSQSKQEASEIDLRKVMKAILKNLWKIAIVTVLFGSVFLFVSYQFLTPMYRTSTSFYVNNKLSLNGVNTNISSNDLVTSISLVNSYIAVLDNRDILNEVIAYADLDLTPSQLSGMISTLVVKETGVFKVTVSSSDPVVAATVAESIAHIVTTQISDIIEGSSVKVIDYPVVPQAPYSPSHAKNTVLGLFMGFIISAGFVALMEIFDTKIKSDDELKRYCNYPILTTIPDMNLSSKKGYYKKYQGTPYGYYSQNSVADADTNDVPSFLGKNIDFATTEAYKLLRTKLQYSLTDNQKCQVFVLSSAIPGEGKSVSSINLAYSFAQLGKNVLLIDADMRRPTLASKLSISNYPGLSEFLTGFMGMDELLQDYSDGGEHSVKILTAGSIPPNPVELLDSNKMTEAFEILRKQFDYIIVDTPPVGDVSDALVASKFADGVLLVVRHDYCNRAALRNTVQQFEFVDAKILGSVFNCLGNDVGKYGSYKYGDRYEYHKRYSSVDQPTKDQTQKDEKK